MAPSGWKINSREGEWHRSTRHNYCRQPIELTCVYGTTASTIMICRPSRDMISRRTCHFDDLRRSAPPSSAVIPGQVRVAVDRVGNPCGSTGCRDERGDVTTAETLLW